MNTILVTDKKPWYRYPMVWMIIAIPAAAICSSSVIMWYAATTKDSLVVDDYYKQGLAINMVLDRDQHAAEKKLSANLIVQPEQKLIKVKFNKGVLPKYPETLMLHLYHATRADSDAKLTMLHGQGDQYIGYLKQPLPPGFWYIELGNKDWRLSAKSRLDGAYDIMLKPVVGAKEKSY
jgi:uncharacterized protein